MWCPPQDLAYLIVPFLVGAASSFMLGALCAVQFLDWRERRKPPPF